MEFKDFLCEFDKELNQDYIFELKNNFEHPLLINKEYFFCIDPENGIFSIILKDGKFFYEASLDLFYKKTDFNLEDFCFVEYKKSIPNSINNKFNQSNKIKTLSELKTITKDFIEYFKNDDINRLKFLFNHDIVSIFSSQIKKEN